MIIGLSSLQYILLLEHYLAWIQVYDIILNVNINGKVCYFHDYDYLVIQHKLMSFNVLQVHIQLQKLIYSAMYHGYVYDVMNIQIWSRYLIVNIGKYIHFDINRVYSPTTGAAVTTFNWYCTITQQTEMILFHNDLFNLMEIYFQLDTTYKYQYQQSLSLNP